MNTFQKAIAKIWVLILILTSSGVSQCINDTPMMVYGTATCYGRPLSNSKVSLNHAIGFVLNQIGTTVTDAEGRFSVSGNALDISRNSASQGLLMAGSLVLIFEFDYHSPGRKKRSFGVGQWESEPVQDFQGTVNMGNVKADSDSCKRYLLFYDVFQDYKRRGGAEEFEFFVQAEEQISSRVPFAYMTNIKIPAGFPMTAEIAKHEFGHILRNYWDGDLEHFKKDVEDYGGFQFHSCDTKTSLQFAFNEGWACFWASQCLTSDGNGPKDIEGNVASAIRSLQVRCKSEDKQMVEVLARNPGAIHTYEEYEKAHQKLYSCS